MLTVHGRLYIDPNQSRDVHPAVLLSWLADNCLGNARQSYKH